MKTRTEVMIPIHLWVLSISIIQVADESSEPEMILTLHYSNK
ncbi:MAG: hypothetical protein QM764_08530 [Chitinophagaceae bacterium]